MQSSGRRVCFAGKLEIAEMLRAVAKLIVVQHFDIHCCSLSSLDCSIERCGSRMQVCFGCSRLVGQMAAR